MKLCLACGERFSSNDWTCPRCARGPMTRATPIFAPELIATSDGYDAAHFAPLLSLEERSFWFRARTRLVIGELRRRFDSASTLLDIGCGTGSVLESLSRTLPGLSLSGSDLYPEALDLAARRLPTARLYQIDCRRLPFDREFDVVSALDVLEHIEEDEVVLAEMYRSLKPGGGVILTVPQHPWLWSGFDVAAHHKRRYRRRELIAKLMRAGFADLKATSFVSLLLPALVAARARVHHSDTRDPLSGYRTARVVDVVLDMVMRVEAAAVARGASFPVGGSLLVSAVRPR